MDLGSVTNEDKCQFNEQPSEREWVTADPDTIDAPAEEPVACPRQALDDAEYCPFHLSKPEQEARDIDTGKRLRERVEAVADEEEITEEFTDFRGAVLRAVDLSGLDLGEMTKFDIDLRYADVEGNIDLSKFSFMATVNCRFVRCNKVIGFGTDLGALDCAGATIQNNVATDKGTDNRAISLRRPGAFDDLSLAEAEVAGDVFINDVDVETKLDGESVTVKGEFRTSADIETCRLSGATVDDSLIFDGGTIGALDCSVASAESAVFHHVTIETLEAVSLSVERLRLQTVTVTDPASFRREENAPDSLELLKIEDSEFRGEVQFDRLEPDTADISIATATDRVSFQDFECHDARFDPDEYPMFEGEVDFTDADLEGAILRNFQAGGQASFKNADLTDARLLNADLTGAILEGTLFSRARLTAADLTDAYLYHASLSDASIDVSTEFGDRVIYDPESSESYDSNLGLDTDSETASPVSADETANTNADDFHTDGGTAEKSERASTEQQRADGSVPPAQKAKEVYQSIHNSARQSGDSAKSISTYRKRQEMETMLLKQGHTGDNSWIPSSIQGVGRQVYGFFTGYGVSTLRILTTCAAIMLLSLAGLVLVGSEQSATLLYVIGGFVGTTPGLEATPGVNLVIGLEALFGALLIALYVNALGRRSSM